MMPVVIRIFVVILYGVLFVLCVALSSLVIVSVLDKLHILNKISGNPFLELLCTVFVVVTSVAGVSFSVNFFEKCMKRLMDLRGDI